MAKDPGWGTKIKAEVTGLKGQCNAGHKVGETFDVSIWDTAGMCGILYHAIFPTLNVVQFDGAYPWGADEISFNCPDGRNLLTVKLTRIKH
jgi:uncharacterized repeat protein (TIGR04076 family)